MLHRRHSPEYNFTADPATGLTFRWGATMHDAPASAPWPELADISISSYCTAGCSFCYRSCTSSGVFMSLDEYSYVLEQLTHPHWGPVFQVALGGGEPLEHPDFLRMIEMTRQRAIVPNFTTRGMKVTTNIATALSGMVGAVAISASSLQSCSFDSVERFIDAGITTNIHYLLQRQSVTEAIEIVEGQHDNTLERVNAVIFLTYKPMGRATKNGCLAWGEEMRRFMQCVDTRSSKVRIGFDACMVPLLMHATRTDRRLIDPCECGFFSIYIDEQLNVLPCSFAPEGRDSFNLRVHDFQRIWSDLLAGFRARQSNDCRRQCSATASCRGICPYFEQIGLCYSPVEEEALT